MLFEKELVKILKMLERSSQDQLLCLITYLVA